ncbi:MAG: nuclear transport factor 2 family protein [Myxococcaceae bacterium]
MNVSTSTSSEDPVVRFCRAFSVLDPSKPLPTRELYAPDIVFTDPFRQLNGLAEVTDYFNRLTNNLVSGRFEFGDPVIGPGRAVVPWTMTVRVRMGPRHRITADGISELRFEDRIVYQRDYFDAGALVYEHLPVMGRAIRLLKKVL